MTRRRRNRVPLRWVILPLLGGALAALAWWLWPSPETPETGALSVPSGQQITLQEVITNQRGPAGLTARFRFVAPGISEASGHVSFETASQDMEAICNLFVVPRLDAMSPQPNQVIISLSEEETEFGVSQPEITQFFEAYSIRDGACHWEGF